MNLDYSYQDTASVTTVQQFIQTGTWVCPVNVTSVIVECWGGGGGGANSSGVNGGGGGGGGGYSKSTVNVTPGTAYTVTVGTGGANGVNGVVGNDSWFNTIGTVLAKGGGGATGSTGGSGGASGSGVGTIVNSGGGGGNGDATNGGGGGGGSGGDTNSGGAGGTSAAGSGGATGRAGATVAGKGSAGGAASAASTSNTLSGGGGGGGTGNGAAGINGLVQLTFTTIGLPTTSTDDIDPDANKNLQNVAVDDGDYFIQYGSEYMIQGWKKTWTNNTDTPSFTWKGRTTEATSISPILIQIFNVNSGAWETLATINKQPADTDLTITVSQTANVANYYNTNNTVTFRAYQQVI